MGIKYEGYKLVKEEADKFGYELQTSFSDFRKNQNRILLKSNLTAQQFMTETMAAYDIVKRGENILQNVYFRNPNNEIVLAPMIWIEKFKIIKTERVYPRNGQTKLPFPIENVAIPKEVEEMYSKRETFLFFNL